MDRPERIQWGERTSAGLELLIKYLKRRDPEEVGQRGRKETSTGSLKTSILYL